MWNKKDLVCLQDCKEKKDTASIGATGTTQSTAEWDRTFVMVHCRWFLLWPLVVNPSTSEWGHQLK